MMTPRPYQKEAVEHAVRNLHERKNSLIVAATGAGKTIMMAYAIGQFFSSFYAVHKRKPHTLVLVHRTEIHDQNHKKFEKATPELATSELTASRKSLHGYVHFGMVQTVSNLLKEFDKVFFDLIVIDEAHHACAETYVDIIDWNRAKNPEAALLGVTATPNRGDKMPLIDLFDNYYQITAKFLFDSHYLVRPDFLDLSPTFLVDGKKTEKGKLNKNLALDMDGQEEVRSLVRLFLKNKLEGKTVVFAPSHAFAEVLVEILQEDGRHPAYLPAGIDPIKREEEFKRFENGNADELVNVDICTEGYDYPELRNVVDFDTNGSNSQWLQKVGRVVRTAPNKTKCLVIDFGGNVLMYPDGIETDVNLQGGFTNPKGDSLSQEDFFKKKDIKEKEPAKIVGQSNENFTPYSLPAGFETLNDEKNGILYVACGEKKDSLIVSNGTQWFVYAGDKEQIWRIGCGGFDSCMNASIDYVGSIVQSEEPITKTQIKLLAPEFPTQTLTKSGANCCLTWKTWRKLINMDMEGETHER